MSIVRALVRVLVELQLVKPGHKVVNSYRRITSELLAHRLEQGIRRIIVADKYFQILLDGSRQLLCSCFPWGPLGPFDQGKHGSDVCFSPEVVGRNLH